MEGNDEKRGRKRGARGNNVAANGEETSGGDTRALRPRTANQSQETADSEEMSSATTRTLRPRTVNRCYAEPDDLEEAFAETPRTPTPRRLMPHTESDDLEETFAETTRMPNQRRSRQLTETDDLEELIAETTRMTKTRKSRKHTETEVKKADGDVINVLKFVQQAREKVNASEELLSNNALATLVVAEAKLDGKMLSLQELTSFPATYHPRVGRQRTSTLIQNPPNTHPEKEDDDLLAINPGTNNSIHEPHILKMKEETTDMDGFEEGDYYPELQQHQMANQNYEETYYYTADTNHQCTSSSVFPCGDNLRQSSSTATYSSDDFHYAPQALNNYQQNAEPTGEEIEVIVLDDDEEDDEIQIIAHHIDEPAMPATIKEEPVFGQQVFYQHQQLYPIQTLGAQLQYVPQTAHLQFHQQHFMGNPGMQHFQEANGFEPQLVQEENPEAPRGQRLLPEAPELILPDDGTVEWKSWSDEQVLSFALKVIKNRGDRSWLKKQGLCVHHLHKLVLDETFYVKMNMKLGVYIRLLAAFHKVMNVRNGHF